MTATQARGLLRRWRAGDPSRDEIDAALVELVALAEDRDRARHLLDQARDPVRRMRAAVGRLEELTAPTD